MADIVEELYSLEPDVVYGGGVLVKAAEEIVRLRKENEELRDRYGYWYD